MQRVLLGLLIAVGLVLAPGFCWAGDQQLAQKVAHNLKASGQLKGYRIGIRCDGGTVWLRGQVSSLEQLNAALQIAAMTEGVQRVVNELEIAPPASPVPTPAIERPKPAPVITQPQAQKTESSKPASALRNLLGAVMGEKVVKAAQPAHKHEVIPAAAEAPTLAPPVVESNQAENTSSEVATEAVPNTLPVHVQVAQPAPAVRVAQAPVVGQPLPIAYVQPAAQQQAPVPQYVAPVMVAGAAPATYEQPNLPNYAWPSYAPYPNYATLTYPRQYSPTAWPYIGPFYPYPQVPLGWRKVTLEWHDGWWFLDFDDGSRSKGLLEGLLRPCK